MISPALSGGVRQSRGGIDSGIDRIVGLDDPEANVTSGAGNLRTLRLANREAAAMGDGLATGGEATTARVVGVGLDAAVRVEVALTDIADRPRDGRLLNRSLDDGQAGDPKVLAGLQDAIELEPVETAGRVEVGCEAMPRLVVQTTHVLDYVAHVLVPFADGIDSRDALFVGPHELRPSAGESLQVDALSQPLSKRSTRLR